jgi:hypothetical protein
MNEAARSSRIVTGGPFGRADGGVGESFDRHWSSVFQEPDVERLRASFQHVYNEMAARGILDV